MTSEFAVAVHALVYLNHKQELLTSEELAENICTNPVRVRKVMTKLRKKGLVETKEGLKGGYFMARSAETLRLSEVCEALEVKLIASAWHSGDSDMDCLIASGMARIMEELYDDLNEICKERLERLTIADIDHRIFQKK